MKNGGYQGLEVVVVGCEVNVCEEVVIFRVMESFFCLACGGSYMNLHT